MNLSVSPTTKRMNFEQGFTMFVSDPLVNWFNKSAKFSPKSLRKSNIKLTTPKKFVKGKSVL